jgi:hypothetical protein
MLSQITPRELAHRAERHAYRMTLAVGAAQQTIERLEFELKLAKAESADRLAQLQIERETLRNLGLQDCETDEVVHSAVLSERQAELLSACAAHTGLFDGELLEALCEVYLAMCERKAA